jgi:hypothetical protein
MKIYKYEIKKLIDIPKGFKVLRIEEQEYQGIIKPYLWALVDTSNEPVTVETKVVATGQEFNADGFDYIGTILEQCGLVYHYYIKM